MKQKALSRTGSRLAAAASLAAAAAMFSPAFAAAAPGDVRTPCADFLAQRPELQASIVRDVLSYKGAGVAPASSSALNSAIAGCQSNIGASVYEVLGGSGR